MSLNFLKKMKKKSRNKKRRTVYPYVCTGCGKKRIAFDYQRALSGICAKCEREKPDENQPPLL